MATMTETTTSRKTRPDELAVMFLRDRGYTAAQIEASRHDATVLTAEDTASVQRILWGPVPTAPAGPAAVDCLEWSIRTLDDPTATPRQREIAIALQNEDNLLGQTFVPPAAEATPDPAPEYTVTFDSTFFYPWLVTGPTGPEAFFPTREEAEIEAASYLPSPAVDHFAVQSNSSTAVDGFTTVMVPALCGGSPGAEATYVVYGLALEGRSWSIRREGRVISFGLPVALAVAKLRGLALAESAVKGVMVVTRHHDGAGEAVENLYTPMQARELLASDNRKAAVAARVERPDPTPVEPEDDWDGCDDYVWELGPAEDTADVPDAEDPAWIPAISGGSPEAMPSDDDKLRIEDWVMGHTEDDDARRERLF